MCGSRPGGKRRRRAGLLLLAVLVLLLSSPAQGQEPPGSVADLLAGYPQGRVVLAPSGALRFFTSGDRPTGRGPAPQGVADSEAIATQFLRSYGHLFGADRPEEQLIPTSTRVTGERTLLRGQQVHRGVPVLGGELLLQVSGGAILSAHGELVRDVAVDTVATLSAERAASLAQEHVAHSEGLPLSQLTIASPELFVFAPELIGAPVGPARLVWSVRVADPAGTVARRVLVNAHTAGVELALDEAPAALNRVVYDNARDVYLGPEEGTLVRTEGSAPSGIADADASYLALGDAYAYFATNHGRDSYDDRGATLSATVRYCNPNSCPHLGAHWTGQGVVLGEEYAVDDVVAHEYVHGIIQTSSGLFYAYQSGAIAESLCDIWGEFVDWGNGWGDDSVDARWLIGEDLAGGPVRNMANPTRSKVPQPDRVQSSYYACDPYYTDFGGVHGNSGILNKAAFLLTDGGEFNGQTVTGLGWEKVSALFYELQTNLLLSGSDFADVAELLPQACLNLVVDGRMAAPDCDQVRSAVLATELALPAVKCGSADPPACELPHFTIFHDDLERPEQGLWEVTSSPGYIPTWYYPAGLATRNFCSPLNATSGVQNLWAVSSGVPSDSAIAMTRPVSLPERTTVYAQFNHWYLFYGYPDGSNDGGVVEYAVGDGPWQDAGALLVDNGYTGTIFTRGQNPLGGRRAFTASSNGYITSRLNLTSLAGQDVRLRFRYGTGQDGYTCGWYIDDISFTTCGAPQPKPPTPTPMPSATPRLTFMPVVGNLSTME